MQNPPLGSESCVLQPSLNTLDNIDAANKQSTYCVSHTMPGMSFSKQLMIN